MSQAPGSSSPPTQCPRGKAGLTHTQATTKALKGKQIMTQTWEKPGERDGKRASPKIPGAKERTLPHPTQVGSVLRAIAEVRIQTAGLRFHICDQPTLWGPLGLCTHPQSCLRGGATFRGQTPDPRRRTKPRRHPEPTDAPYRPASPRSSRPHVPSLLIFSATRKHRHL